MSLPFVTALCPTFRHPELLANSVALWLAQDYPIERRELVILDDGQTFDFFQKGESWHLWSVPERLPSLPAKYNMLITLAGRVSVECPNVEQPDILLVWEDDDIYLPSYCSSHVRALQNAEFSKPSKVLSDYGRIVHEEGGAGRFHASMAFRADLLRRIGGWPDTKRADFDQQLMRNAAMESEGIGDPCKFAPPQYIYGWHTGAAHCQSTMRSPDDEDWYARGEQAYAKVPFVGKLEPKFDQRTLNILRELDTPCRCGWEWSNEENGWTCVCPWRSQ